MLPFHLSQRNPVHVGRHLRAITLHFRLVLRIEVASRATDGRTLGQKGRLGGIRRAYVSRGAARIDDALETRGLGGAEKITRPLDVHLPLPLCVVDGIKLPGEVQSRVDPARAQKVSQLSPR